MKTKCLFCYKKLSVEVLKTSAGKLGYHPSCSKTFFGREEPPVLPFSQDEITELAREVIKSQKTVTGVQPKLSLSFSKEAEQPERFTIVGFWGEYILKPQTKNFAHLPENESLTMHLAELSGINTVQHGLIYLESGELAYITKRIDRKKDKKFPMEDMCQLTERLTEHKYKGSYEQISKAIHRYSANPGLDNVNFYELVLFSFLTGNNDMHLKNFSLIKLKNDFNLCPAYDLLNAAIVMPEDNEELALNLNGKKKKINKKDFETAMKNTGLNDKVIENIFTKYQKLIPKWIEFIPSGFLPKEEQNKYIEIIRLRASKLEFKV
ncbi:MAG TPA: HipA domain-containing protein [Flavobacteriaceae bacterium]|nr:HipA domain-containing protein [Flavobacteriaceae bacterium]